MKISLKVSSECCVDDNTSEFCTVYNLLSPTEQFEIRQYLGEDCDGDADEVIRKIEKRKPNFIRFGRAGIFSVIYIYEQKNCIQLI